jgi:hypothetical protein
MLTWVGNRRLTGALLEVEALIRYVAGATLPIWNLPRASV